MRPTDADNTKCDGTFLKAGHTYIYTYEGWEEFRDALELKINQLIKNTSITGNLNVAFFSKRQAAHYFFPIMSYS